MSSFTNFLNLFKWNPQTDAEEAFDIDKALNENWDKIDTKMSNINQKVSNQEEEIHGYVSNAYDNTKTYVVGDYCIYNNTLYRCTTAITTAEEFDVNKWEQINLTTAIADSVKTQYFNGSTTSINELNTNGKWRGWIPVGSDNYNYLGFNGNVIVETFVEAPTRQCMQRITQMDTGKQLIRYCDTNNFSYNDPLYENYVPKSQIGSLTAENIGASSGTAWSKELTRGTYLIVVARTNNSNSNAGLYIANIFNYSYLTTIKAYSSGTLTLSDKTISITPTGATQIMILKMAV